MLGEDQFTKTTTTTTTPTAAGTDDDDDDSADGGGDDDNDDDADGGGDDDNDNNDDAPKTCTRVVAMLGRATSSSKSVKRLTVLLARLGTPRSAITNG